jgi:hypothetical protein
MSSRVARVLRHLVPVAPAAQPSVRALSTSARPNAAAAGVSVVSSPDAPKAIGPYSQAIKANGFVFVSGCLGINPKSGDITGDVVAQTKQAMENMRAVLTAGNSSFPQVSGTHSHMHTFVSLKAGAAGPPWQCLLSAPATRPFFA